MSSIYGNRKYAFSIDSSLVHNIDLIIDCKYKYNYLCYSKGDDDEINGFIYFKSVKVAESLQKRYPFAKWKSNEESFFVWKNRLEAALALGTKKIIEFGKFPVASKDRSFSLKSCSSSTADSDTDSVSDSTNILVSTRKLDEENSIHVPKKKRKIHPQSKPSNHSSPNDISYELSSVDSDSTSSTSSNDYSLLSLLATVAIYRASTA